MRIGCGAGFSSDRLQPAIDLATEGALDAIIFECVGERTLAFGHRDRLADPQRGYNPQLGARLRGVLPATHTNRTTIITNMGVANVPAAAEVARGVARDLGLNGLTIAAVTGDDVSDTITPDTVLYDFGGRTIADVGLPLVGANVYLGADAILPALDEEAHVVITGRVADPALVLAPLRHRYGWAGDDWDHLARGTVAGHLLECGMQITGGYFADPGYKDVPDLAHCGFPLAEVGPDGTTTITKLERAGGRVDLRTVKEQLLYEVHDPTAYLTPDVTADFSTVTLTDNGPDRVRVAAAQGRVRPDQLKVTVGFDGGHLGEAGISYAGPNAVARAALARAILQERVQVDTGRLRIDLIGVDALHASASAAAGRDLTELAQPDDEANAAVRDVRVRCALRSTDRDEVGAMLWEVESLLCCGPAGGGGYRGQITPCVVTHSALIDRDAVRPEVALHRS
ncbi:MAG: acyclic terpene utilization AtuA family protein [Pseudomonadota bacterium]